MWFVFPQIAGLGHSATSKHFAISSLDEAKAYLQHDVLGPRLIECTNLVATTPSHDAADIFGEIDAQKLRSSMTLFMRAAPDEPLFRASARPLLRRPARRGDRPTHLISAASDPAHRLCGYSSSRVPRPRRRLTPRRPALAWPRVGRGSPDPWRAPRRRDGSAPRRSAQSRAAPASGSRRPRRRVPARAAVGARRRPASPIVSTTARRTERLGSASSRSQWRAAADGSASASSTAATCRRAGSASRDAATIRSRPSPSRADAVLSSTHARSTCRGGALFARPPPTPSERTVGASAPGSRVDSATTNASVTAASIRASNCSQPLAWRIVTATKFGPTSTLVTSSNAAKMPATRGSSAQLVASNARLGPSPRGGVANRMVRGLGVASGTTGPSKSSARSGPSGTRVVLRPVDDAQ